MVGAVQQQLFPEHRTPHFEFLKNEELREAYQQQNGQATPLAYLAFHGLSRLGTAVSA